MIQKLGFNQNHRSLHHSTLGSRVIKKREEKRLALAVDVEARGHELDRLVY